MEGEALLAVGKLRETWEAQKEEAQQAKSDCLLVKVENTDVMNAV